MQYRPLGRTGVMVSVVSLGSGGPSRLGQSRGAPRKDMARLVRTALDVGVNFFDTAPAYGDSEEILGAALAGVDRSGYLMATKVTVMADGRVQAPEEADASVTRSLRRLQTDHLDVVQLHGVRPASYAEVVSTILPVLERRRDAGDVRFLGITEASGHDPAHAALTMALDDGRFDTVMVAYNGAHRSAEEAVLPRAAEAGTAVIVMKAVGPGAPAPAAYRFAADHPAVATVLTGTAHAGHLVDNVAAVLRE
jgi:L-galactose dehydrogenase